MAKSRMLSNTVVEDLDVFRDFAFGLFVGRKSAVMHQFRLQDCPAAFHWCVIPAVALAAHGDLHTELAEKLLIGV